MAVANATVATAAARDTPLRTANAAMATPATTPRTPAAPTRPPVRGATPAACHINSIPHIPRRETRHCIFWDGGSRGRGRRHRQLVALLAVRHLQFDAGGTETPPAHPNGARQADHRRGHAETFPQQRQTPHRSHKQLRTAFLVVVAVSDVAIGIVDAPRGTPLPSAASLDERGPTADPDEAVHVPGVAAAADAAVGVVGAVPAPDAALDERVETAAADAALDERERSAAADEAADVFGVVAAADAAVGVMEVALAPDAALDECGEAAAADAALEGAGAVGGRRKGGRRVWRGGRRRRDGRRGGGCAGPRCVARRVRGGGGRRRGARRSGGRRRPPTRRPTCLAWRRTPTWLSAS